jgi:adenosine deaminase
MYADPSRFTSLDDFLHYYYIGMSVLLHAADFEALAWDYFERVSKDGVHHAELFFDPQAHTSRGVQYTVVLDGFLSACKRAKEELGITSELTTCYLRHLPVHDSLTLFDHEQVQASYMGGQIIGIGLDSSEAGNPPHRWAELFERARAMGLRLTAHAGEEGPADFVLAALKDLGVERIDHGVKLAENDAMLKEVAATGTMLTVCPVSNVVLKGFSTLSDVPIRKFIDAGIKFSINSDDPAYFGCYILDNYCQVQEAFNLSVKEWTTICTNAIEGSWCSVERKQELLQNLETAVRAFI